MKKHKTKELVEIALLAALLCVIAPFTLPVPGSPVPLSLATFGVYLAALLLGAKQGVLCVLVYLLLGMVGLPVFSGFSGGIGVLLGPTGGYLVGYVPCAWVLGVLIQAGKSDVNRKNFAYTVLAMVAGTLMCYLTGTAWFVIAMGETYTVIQAIAVCVVPYLLFDAIKIVLAAVTAIPIQKILRRMEQR